MKALRKVRQGCGNVELGEVRMPEPANDEILMKVWAAGVCGSDLLIQEDRHFYRAPVTLGHEFSGIVEATGPNVQSVRVGDKVAADIETRTGWLGVTRDGAFAPYMTVPEAQVYSYAADVSLDHACMTEPVVATIHSMQERGNVKAGDFVAIIGPGPMGLLGVQFAKLRGARAVALVGLKKDEARLAIGRKVGADYLLYSEERPEEAIRELTRGRGADFVLECSASGRGLQHAIDCARRSPEGKGGNGRIAVISLFGKEVSINLDPLSLGQLDMVGAWSWNGRETWERAVDLISRKVFDLDSLITSRYPLDQWETAFDNLRRGKDVKAFIQPGGAN